jgi:hypothetical protein
VCVYVFIRSHYVYGIGFWEGTNIQPTEMGRGPAPPPLWRCGMGRSSTRVHEPRQRWRKSPPPPQQQQQSECFGSLPPHIPSRIRKTKAFLSPHLTLSPPGLSLHQPTIHTTRLGHKTTWQREKANRSYKGKYRLVQEKESRSPAQKK